MVGGQSIALQAALYGTLTSNPDLATLRDQRTATEPFRRAATQISVLLVAEALRDLPTSGATVTTPLGATWTDTTTENDRAAGSVTVTSISRSHAAAWEDRSGVRTMRVEVTSNFTIKGGGQQAGQPFEVAGAGVRSGVDYIAVDGRYLGGESHDSTSMTITLPIQAMTIPRTQVSRTTVTVLP